MFDASATEPDAPSLGLVDADTIPVINKIDLATRPLPIKGIKPRPISCGPGKGISSLLDELTAFVTQRFGVGEAPALTRARHRAALEDCVAALRRAQAAALPELAAEDYRIAVRALGRVTGRVDVEDLLDVIFPRLLYRQIESRFT